MEGQWKALDHVSFSDVLIIPLLFFCVLFGLLCRDLLRAALRGIRHRDTAPSKKATWMPLDEKWLWIGGLLIGGCTSLLISAVAGLGLLVYVAVIILRA